MTDTGIVNIHGKQYHTVAKRVQDFRESYADYSLTTEIAVRDGDIVVMKATITNNEGCVIATGHAEEDRTKGNINRTSALENAETSAIGRALAAFGIGGTEFASANEVQNAIHQQNEKPATITEAQQTEIMDLCRQTGINVQEFLKVGGFKDTRDIPASQFDNARSWILNQAESKKEKTNA